MPYDDFTLRDHQAACFSFNAGTTSPRLPHLMAALCSMIDQPGETTFHKGDLWVAASRREWASGGKPWGRPISVATFGRVLDAGRKAGVLECTVAGHSHAGGYDQALHLRPADDYLDRLLSARAERLGQATEVEAA